MRVNKLSVTTDLVAILREDPAVMALVGEKIFPLIAPKDTTGDYIVYKRVKYTATHCSMGRVTDECKVYFNTVSDNYDRGQSAAVAIHKALEGIFGDPDMTIRLENSEEDFFDGKYIQVLLFSIE